MALSAKLQLKQSQSLVMTPQLMQSIRLLQFTAVELDRFVEQEIERNPLIERDDAREDAAEAPPVASEAPEASADWMREDLEWDSGEIAGKLDTSLENVFPDDPGSREPVSAQMDSSWKSSPGSAGGSNLEAFDLDQITAAPQTLSGHVQEQIALSIREAGDRLIAAELTDALDGNGYCQADADDIALRLGTTAEDVARVLSLCQQFDPPGIFARDLAECLAIQLKALDRYDPAMQAMVAHLELLARRDFQALKGLCGVEEDDLLDMLAEIRALDPKPGSGFESGVADPVIPDVTVRAAADGSWSIELNPDALPRVLMDQAYVTQVQANARTSADREFISECLQNANWLTRSLDQRAKTILKVATEIVRQQDAFLVHGVTHLRPLNLRTVADAISMHESTVSRVTANKYMMTPRGVFEMRYFFTAAIASAEGGDAHSAESVRHRIRQLIDEEAASNVLSDDAIVDLLNKAGVDVARRTVAKYREGMNIPSSVQRRREKRAKARAAV
ncbi:MAG: RNA polymerase factor sigma-54 [Notoacmeibacter sp.]|nr:RNA polymerase factor sigma-54 [Notoacmeibacter sp.]MCC0032390.1 RNA polymerase factor sigma-54 [Brucellaceae bacterium]